MIDSKHDEIWGLVIGNVVCLEGKTNQNWGRDPVTIYIIHIRTVSFYCLFSALQDWFELVYGPFWAEDSAPYT